MHSAFRLGGAAWRPLIGSAQIDPHLIVLASCTVRAPITSGEIPFLLCSVNLSGAIHAYTALAHWTGRIQDEGADIEGEGKKDMR